MPQVSVPGEKALTLMKINDELGVFKVPKAPVRKKQRVLEENTYLEEMGKIIQRDFFPDLEKLKAQNEYLDAQSQNDSERMMQIYAKYSLGKRPPTERIPSPATFETPLQSKCQVDAVEEANIDLENLKKSGRKENKSGDDKKEVKILSKAGEKKLSLDQYLALHTSEDNESFKEIQKESAVKHEIKYSWLYKDENKINSLAIGKLKVPSIEQQAQGEEKPLVSDTWTYKNQNYCMFVPEGVELSEEERNELVRKKQEIAHENTRLAKNPFDEKQNKDAIHELAMCQAKTQEGKIGVDGKIVTCAETPKVNGFSFVRTPSPMPGVSESPLITWGEIEGTPFRLDGSDTPYVSSSGPTFRIPEIPKREKIALALADKANESYRDKKRKAIAAARSSLVAQSPNRSNSSINRLNEMSPAAQRLASASLSCRLGTDRALRNSYSPSPKRTSLSPYSVTPKTPKILKTPAANPREQLRQLARRSTPVGVTDDLLKLPLRNSYSQSPKRIALSPFSVTPKTPKILKITSASPREQLKQLARRSTTPVSVTDDLLKLPQIGNSRPKASDFF